MALSMSLFRSLDTNWRSERGRPQRRDAGLRCGLPLRVRVPGFSAEQLLMSLRPKTGATSLRALFKLSASWTTYEDLRPTRGQTLTWMYPEGRTRAVLLTQKEPVFRRIAPGLAERSIATCLVPYPIPNSRVCGTIERMGRAVKAPLYWFGDLDPIGLTAFEALRVATKARHRTATYLGIDDRWLSVLKREEGNHVHLLERQLIAMGREEREHFERIVDFARNIQIGERCFALLTSGKKLEVEGLMTMSPTLLRRVPNMIARRIQAIG